MFLSIWEDLISLQTYIIIPSSNSSVSNKTLYLILSCSMSIHAPNVKCSRLHNSLEMVLPFLILSIVLSLLHKIKRTEPWKFIYTILILVILIHNMISEITEETDEEPHWFINTEDQKEKIRKVIQNQKSLYCSSSSFSSSAASCSSFSSSQRSNSLLDLMKGGSTSMRRLFDMEHTSLATHFDSYSGSPIIKPISLWDSDSERKFQDPWALIKQIGSTPFIGTDRESELASKGSHIDADFSTQNRNHKTSKHKLTRKKSFRRLPGFGLWRCGRFRFFLRFKRLKVRIWGRKFR